MKKKTTFALPKARVAELVDASVSKTDEVTLVPVRCRPRVQKKSMRISHAFFIITMCILIYLIGFISCSKEVYNLIG